MGEFGGLPGAEVEGAELVEGEVVDGAMAVGAAVEVVVMGDDEVSVPGGMDVEFDRWSSGRGRGHG